MHLTKEDIEQVAWHRFNKTNMRYWYAVLLGSLAALIALTLGLSHLFPENGWPVVATGIAVLALLVVGLVRHNKAQQRAAKELIKQCEADPHLIYVPDEVVAPGTARQPPETKWT